jgi:membrane protein DedA with SNARE-associated domain
MLEQYTMIVSLIESVFNLLGWWGIGGLMVLDSATGLTPSTAVLTLSGWVLISMQQQPVVMVFVGSAIAALGSSLGASLTYWISRLGGRKVVDALMRRFRVKAQTVQRVEQQFDKYGAWLIVVGRFLPAVRQLVSIPAGLARMPFWKFLLSTAISSFLWALVYISGGYYLGEELPRFSQQLGGYSPYLVAVGVLGACLALGAWLLSRHRARGNYFTAKSAKLAEKSL